jgi:hypothetical protein
LKVALILIPLTLPWFIWATVSVFTVNTENRILGIQVTDMMAHVAEHNAVIDKLKDFMSLGGRFTEQDGLKLKLELLDRIDAVEKRMDARNAAQDIVVQALPPQAWKDKINDVEKLVRENNAALIEMRTLFQAHLKEVEKKPAP